MTEPMTTNAASTAAHAARYAEEAIARAARERGEPDWLVALRGEAARAFASTPMPGPQLRPWKYTDVTGLAIEAYPPVEARGSIAVRGAAPAGGFAGSLEEAAADPTHGERVRERLGQLVRATEGRFLAANAALWRDGAFVYAPRGRRFDEPVVIEVDAPAGAGVFPRLLVVSEPAAELTVLLRQRSGSEDLLASGVVEIFAGDDSTVRIVLDGRWGDATREFTTVRSQVGRGASVQVASMALGGLLVKQTLESMLEGEGARSSIRGVALGDGDQHFDFVTLQDHIGAHTESDVEIKSALAGASRSIYYGVTRVEETAAGANAEQENRNLLLSDHAKADSDPVLEILTSNVIRCGHGATVGPVDREALFYLQSRGLGERQALQLLVGGFFRSVVQDIPLPGLDDELADVVVQKLEHATL